MQQLGVAIGPRWPTTYHVDRTIVGERGDRSAGGLIPAAAASIARQLKHRHPVLCLGQLRQDAALDGSVALAQLLSLSVVWRPWHRLLD